MSERLAEEIFRTASESIEVLALPVDAVAAEAAAQRRRRRRTTLATVAGGIAVVGAMTLVATVLAGDEPTDAGATSSPNPVGVPWYAGGRLHLAGVVLDAPPLTDLVAVDDEAVYGDHTGAVVLVNAEGDPTTLGQKLPATRLVAASDSGWVAWVDPGTVPGLVVYDVRAREEVDRLELQAAAGSDNRAVPNEPIAIAGDRVYYTGPDGDFVWQPDAEVETVEPPGLLDVASVTQVFELPQEVRILQPFFGLDYTRRGAGAQLSPGGGFLLSRVPGEWAPGLPFEVLLYDTRSGERLPTGLGSGERAVDATFGTDHDVVYLVAHVEDLRPYMDIEGEDSRLLVLRSCELGTGECHDVAPVPRPGEVPLLAH